MPEIATETTPLSETLVSPHEVSRVIALPPPAKSDPIDVASTGVGNLSVEPKELSLSYDAPPFVPRSVITENKLLAAFKNQVQSSSEFDSGESAGEFSFYGSY